MCCVELCNKGLLLLCFAQSLWMLKVRDDVTRDITIPVPLEIRERGKDRERECEMVERERGELRKQMQEERDVSHP